MLLHKRRLRSALTGSAATFLATSVMSASALAQVSDQVAEQELQEEVEQIIVTGTRIQNPDIVAASPITVVGLEEIEQKFTPNIERVFRDLPITIPGDGQNVNNGTAGRAEVDLRGLGPERSLNMIDGKRINPHDIDGISDVNFIPLNMLERVDIITGGASAVYGSDAMSGAINFILKKDFEGIEIDAGFSTTNDGGGDIYDVSVLFGTNLDDGRGNVTLSATFTDRKPVLLADREFGLFGVASDTGSGLGTPPATPPGDCSGNTEFSTAFETNVGSTTSIPGTLDLRSGTSFQFRNDMSIGDRCARFNFNPFNYYQTPQRRWQAFATANYEINEWVEMYGRAGFSSSGVNFQIAPSGTFGQSFTVPLRNPFFSDAVRTAILDDLNTFAAEFIAGLDPLDPDEAAILAADPMGFLQSGIVDVNGNGVFDLGTGVDGDFGDAFLSTARRRTLELGPRSALFDTDQWQMVWGIRGEVPWLEGFNYDLSWQRGESDFVETRDGFTNLTNLALGINTVDPDQCISVTGTVTGAPCTPINVFGPLGSITDQQRDDGFFVAIASDLRKATQTVIHGSMSGEIERISSPWSDNGLSIAVGFERRKETASSSPDECLKLAPSSCQGGAGGNRLPIQSEYSAWEGFGEMIWPIIEGVEGIENLSLEAGFRFSSFNPQGDTTTWKAGMTWETIPGLRFRYMEQRAVRVANIGELGSPVTTGLDNATFDPCSVGNTGTISAELAALCVATGVPSSLVGSVQDIISGQVNVFSGTNLNDLPDPETARTRTAGVQWQFDPGTGGFTSTTLTMDYYRINIRNFIDSPSGQEALDLCYVLADPTACAGIVRIGGALTVSGTGVPAFITNFDFFRSEGLQFGVRTGYELDDWGSLTFSMNANLYLANEFQTTAASDLVDCKGRYGTSCDPVPKWRHTARLSWMKDEFDASILWRRIGSMDAQENEADALFPAFRSIGAFNYFDFSAGFQVTEQVRLSGLVSNIANKKPPIIGNETGSTSFNSGNTFPSIYDVLGRIYSVNLKFNF